MSIKSQTNNMRRLAALLDFDLCDIHGKKECGPNGSKQVFLNVGKVFLRALARDLGLREVTVSSNAGGIGVSGDCSLIGMWESGGLYLQKAIDLSGCGGVRNKCPSFFFFLIIFKKRVAVLHRLI